MMYYPSRLLPLPAFAARKQTARSSLPLSLCQLQVNGIKKDGTVCVERLCVSRLPLSLPRICRAQVDGAQQNKLDQM